MDKNYSITGRGEIGCDLGFICYPCCYPQRTMGYEINRNPLILRLVANQAFAVEYYCEATKRINSENEYLEEDIMRFKLEEVGNKAFLSRCSFSPSEGKETCDRYEVDHIERYPVTDGETLEKVFIVKYYYFRGHLDFQIFPNMSFAENNGRKGIQFGKCRITSP